MIYAFIDTNIWVRVLSQGRPGCELEYLDNFHKLCLEKKAVFLLPEIIELELEKQWREFTEEMTKEIGQLQVKIENAIKPKLWTEIEDVYASINSLLNETKQKKVEAARQSFEKIQLLFESNGTVKIPLTSELLFLGKRRLISGKMPKPDNQAHNDATIVESLQLYFRTNPANQSDRLCFCSENVNDFGVQTKEGMALHPFIKDGLAPAHYATTLRAAIEFISSQPVISEPSAIAIAEALEQQLINFDEETDYEKCLHHGCAKEAWHFGQFCKDHLLEHMRQLPEADQKRFQDTIAGVLNTLTYKESEIFKLRTGYGDGYIYTQRECARIFKCSIAWIRKIERTAFRKLRHPVRSRQFDQYF
jgi:PIN domain/Sigma-70, region 4